jgi:hypothetical protein
MTIRPMLGGRFHSPIPVEYLLLCAIQRHHLRECGDRHSPRLRFVITVTKVRGFDERNSGLATTAL